MVLTLLWSWKPDNEKHIIAGGMHFQYQIENINMKRKKTKPEIRITKYLRNLGSVRELPKTIDNWNKFHTVFKYYNY